MNAYFPFTERLRAAIIVMVIFILSPKQQCVRLATQCHGNRMILLYVTTRRENIKNKLEILKIPKRIFRLTGGLFLHWTLYLNII